MHEDTPYKRNEAFAKYMRDIHPTNQEVEKIRQKYLERTLATDVPVDLEQLKALYNSLPEVSVMVLEISSLLLLERILG